MNTPDDAHAVAEALRAGRVAVIPTDTVYGLAADPRNEQAVARLFELKGRPADNPLPLLVADADTAMSCCSDWPGVAERLAAMFWPGPLTIVAPAAEWIPTSVTAGSDHVGVRQPAHAWSLALLRAFGSPLACTSANASGDPPASALDQLPAQFFASDVSRTDAGRLPPSPASTVVRVQSGSLDVLREGSIGAEALQEAIRAGGPGAAP